MRYSLGRNGWCLPVKIEAAVMLAVSSGLNKKQVIKGRLVDRDDGTGRQRIPGSSSNK